MGYFIGLYKTQIEEKIPKFKKLMDANIKVKNSKFYGFFNAVKMVIRVNFNEFMDSKLKITEIVINNKKINVVKYIQKSKLYYIPILKKIKSGPKEDVKIYSKRISDLEFSLDIELMKLLGPNQDFHGISFTPFDFGFGSIKISTPDKETVFNSFDTLCV